MVFFGAQIGEETIDFVVPGGEVALEFLETLVLLEELLLDLADQEGVFLADLEDDRLGSFGNFVAVNAITDLHINYNPSLCIFISLLINCNTVSASCLRGLRLDIIHNIATCMKQYPLTLLLTFTASAAALSTLPLLSAASTLAAGLAGWALTAALMPKVAEFMLKQKIFGLDINKKGSKGGEK